MAKAPTTTDTAVLEKPVTQEVAVQPKGGALALPSFMQNQGGAGLENVDASDMQTPRLRLLQALSPECEEFEDAKPGHFWHDMAQASVGKEVDITFVYVDKRAILWRPRPEGGILARSDDLLHWSPSNKSFEVKLKSGKVVVWNTGRNVTQSGLLDWGSSDPDNGASQPAGTLMYNFLGIIPSRLELPPAVTTMQRSASKVARKLLGRLKVMGGAPLYGIKLKMSSFLDESPDGKFHNYKFAVDGFVDDEGLFMANKALYEAVSRSGLKIREEDEDLANVASQPAAVDGVGDGKAEY